MSCRKDGGCCDGVSLVCRLNPEAGEQVYRDLGDVVDRPFPNSKCSYFGKQGLVLGSSYEFHPEVNMGNYVPLRKRHLEGLCDCPACVKSLKSIGITKKALVRSTVRQDVFAVRKPVIFAVSGGKKRVNYGSIMIRKLANDESDFNRFLEMVICFLKGYEPFRLNRKNRDGSDSKDILWISEILALKQYHASIWGR